MARTPRITATLSPEDQKLLNKVLDELRIKSPGQLLSMLVSGDTKQLEWIIDGFKRVNQLF